MGGRPRAGLRPALGRPPTAHDCSRIARARYARARSRIAKNTGAQALFFLFFSFLFFLFLFSEQRLACAPQAKACWNFWMGGGLASDEPLDATMGQDEFDGMMMQQGNSSSRVPL